jgi:tRNA threonylcarbamoyladenosine biosynthesis protein TsaB
MIILAISTSSSNASVSLLEDDKLIKELNISDQRTHSEKLMPLIEELFKTTNLQLSQVNLIACDIGPGSFTGIRIGVASVKAMAEAKEIPVVGVSSLEALAYNVRGFDYICSIIDARNNQVYSAIFNKNYELISDYFADNINNLTSIFKQYKNMAYVGDGLKLLNNSFEFDNNIYSRNVGLAGYKKFSQGLYTDADNLSVMYLRPSQAERMRNNNGNM